MDRYTSTDMIGLADLPDISKEQTFFDIVRCLATYISSLIVVPYTFEDLRIGQGHLLLVPLTEHLGDNCQQPEIVAALLALKWHYSLDPDDRGIMQTRGWACEIIAWRYLSYLSEYDLLDFLLYEVRPRRPSRLRGSTWFRSNSQVPTEDISETTNLLQRVTSPQPSEVGEDDENDPTARFAGLNALEIAAVAEAKKFLAQRSVQRIVGAIWRGDVVFWPALNVATTKKPQRYNPRKSDPYARLRVPQYQKLFEALFFASFLALYYAVLLERHPEKITPLEVLLYIWIAAFAYDEFGELRDTGSLFYTADVWNLWDICIVIVAGIFLIFRIIGLVKNDSFFLDISFDILSLEALFLVPRLCSILSVNPYFGTLIPCLKEMTKDFVKFLAVVIILYLGFLTTFAMLARDHFTVKHISWILVYVFFGSSYLGFDIASEISPMLGPPLMMVFVALTNILLLTSLISLLSNSLTKIMDHAREEYLFQYSLFVLEASASRRLTYYLPPFNLIPLILFRPLRPFVKADTLRQLRITTLKVTHWPFVLLIWTYESAPEIKRWLSPWLSGSHIDEHDEGITNNIFNAPRQLNGNHAPQTSNKIVADGTNTADLHIPRSRKPEKKNWSLDLQPRQSQGRNVSYGYNLAQAANNGNGDVSGSDVRQNDAAAGGGANASASGSRSGSGTGNATGGSMRDLRRQSQIHATLRRHETGNAGSSGSGSGSGSGNNIAQADNPDELKQSGPSGPSGQALSRSAPISAAAGDSSLVPDSVSISAGELQSLQSSMRNLEQMLARLLAERAAQGEGEAAAAGSERGPRSAADSGAGAGAGDDEGGADDKGIPQNRLFGDDEG